MSAKFESGKQLTAGQARFLEVYDQAPEWGKRRIEAAARLLGRVVRPSDPGELKVALGALFANSPSWRTLRSIQREAWILIAAARSGRLQE